MGYKGYPFSKTTYYRRKRKAAKLGCDIMDVPDMRGKVGGQPKGKDCARWSDDRMISSRGYVKIRVGKSHPLADPNGYAHEHTVVWYAAGDTLGEDEVLHHLNGNRLDNRWENLQRMTKSEHNKLHAPPRDPETGRFLPRDDFPCDVCQYDRPGGPLCVPECKYDPRSEGYVGKRAAGRLLDGREHMETPEALC